MSWQTGQRLFAPGISALISSEDGVIDGGAVSPQSTPDMTVDVAACRGLVAGRVIDSAAATLTIAAADATDERFDLIVTSSQDGAEVVTGTAGTDATPPAVPTGHLLLAIIEVPASASSISATEIRDRRRQLRRNHALYASTVQEVRDALTDLDALGGGTLWVNPGTYTVSSPILIPSNVRLIGAGRETVFVNASAADDHVITNADVTGGNTDIAIENLVADGNQSQQSASPLNTIRLENVSRGALRGVEVRGAQREGLALRQSDSIHVQGGYIHDNLYDGIKLWEAEYCRIEGVLLEDNGRSGIQCARLSPSGNVSRYNTISNVVVRHTTGTPGPEAPVVSGIYLHLASHNTVSGITVAGVVNAVGFWEESNANVVTGLSGWVRQSAGGNAIEFGSEEAGEHPDFNVLSDFTLDLRGDTGGSPGTLLNLAHGSEGGASEKNRIIQGTVTQETSGWDVTIDGDGTEVELVADAPLSVTDNGTGTIQDIRS